MRARGRSLGVFRVVSANEIVRWLLDEPTPVRQVTEASVHLPRRSKIWVATYSGPEPGKQIWRSTGLTNRVQALILARRWEAQARQQRAAWHGSKKPVVRNRRSDPGGGLSQKEVADVLRMTPRGTPARPARPLRIAARFPLAADGCAAFERRAAQLPQRLSEGGRFDATSLLQGKCRCHDCCDRLLEGGGVVLPLRACLRRVQRRDLKHSHPRRTQTCDLSVSLTRNLLRSCPGNQEAMSRQ